MNLTSPRDQALRIAVHAVIASEALMFAVLIAIRGTAPIAPTAATVTIAAAVTASLLVAAGSLASALRRMREGNAEASTRMLGSATALGFLALVLELVGARRFGPADPLSVVLVGLHAAHVAAGVALASWALALVRSRRLHRHHHLALRLVATYWYFVAAVWLFVWPLLTTRP